MSRRLYLPLIGITLFVVFSLARLPLSLVLSLSGAQEQGLTWSGVEGTLWDGTLSGVAFDGYPVGRVEQRTSLLALFSGRISSELRLSGAALNGEGRITLSPGKAVLRDTALLIDLGAYGIVDAFGASMRGMMRLETDRLALSAERCETGQVSLWTDTLTYSARAYGGNGFPLSGVAQCTDNGALTVSLDGAAQQGPEAAQLTATIQPSLDFLAEVTARGLAGEAADGLLLYGFEQRGDGLVLIQRGNLLDAG